MIAVLNGGPWHGSGFPFGTKDAKVIADAGRVTVYTKLIDGQKHLQTREGARANPDEQDVAVYDSDPEMTMLHGWIELSDHKLGPDGTRMQKAAVFTFNREWTAALARR